MEDTEDSVHSPASSSQNMFLFNCTLAESVWKDVEPRWCAVDQKSSCAILNVLRALRLFSVSSVLKLLP